MAKVQVNRNVTQSRVKELFDYHEDGYLIRKIPISSEKVGSIIGNTSGDYPTTSIDNRMYAVHRIIFLWHHGYLPDLVDHEDRNPKNRKIENLRPLSQSCNIRNSKPRKDNKSGVKGVCWDKNRNRWKAYVTVNGRVINLGSFTEFALAVIARYKEEIRLNWKGCNSTSCSYNYLKENGLLSLSNLDMNEA